MPKNIWVPMQNTGEFLFTYVYTYERAAAIYVHLSNFFYKTGDGNLIESRKLFSSCQKAVKNDLQHLKKCASKVDHIVSIVHNSLVSIVHNSQVFERCTNLRSDTAPKSQKLPLKTKHM